LKRKLLRSREILIKDISVPENAILLAGRQPIMFAVIAKIPTIMFALIAKRHIRGKAERFLRRTFVQRNANGLKQSLVMILLVKRLDVALFKGLIKKTLIGINIGY